MEGIITFISPCLLPMLPVYVSYFAGQQKERNKRVTLINAAAFVFGFTVVFVLMGAFAGSVGGVLKEYRTAVNVFSGVIVILFGLSYMELVPLPFLGSNHQMNKKVANSGVLSSVLFGIIFSIGWTPCVGAFLGSALMLAASSGESLKGVFMLLSFSLGLGIPFIASAVLIDRLRTAFDFMKRNYRYIRLISGGLLIIIGVMMLTGLMGYFLSLLTF
nr:cytochrome c biogenesis CcdA family protein [Caproiciproducens faecalis]